MSDKPAELSPLEVVPGSSYSQPEIDRGLMALAYCNGSSRRAERFLDKQGERISEATLRRWREDLYPARYSELKAKVLPRVLERDEEGHAEMVSRGFEVEAMIFDRIAQEVDGLDPRDLHTAGRNVATMIGIHADHALKVREQRSGAAQPSNRQIGDILEALKGRGIRLEMVIGSDDTDTPEPAIDSTATETNPQPSSPQQSPSS